MTKSRTNADNAAADILGVTAGTGISGGGTSGTPTVSIDTATTVDKTTAQTLTNKTLTSPVLTTPSISTITTKGDLLGFDTALNRVPIGTNNQVLTADSAQALGLKWATPASGGGQTLISTNTLSSTSTTITIPSGYKDIIIKTNNWTISGAQQWRVRLNSNTGSVYGWAGVNRQGTSSYLVGGTLTDWESSGTGISAGNIQMQMCIYDYLATNTRLGTMNAAYTITASSAASNENWTLSFLDSTAITSVTLSGLSGGTLSGTCYMIGVN